jgi:hypothetical protein
MLFVILAALSQADAAPPTILVGTAIDPSLPTQPLKRALPSKLAKGTAVDASSLPVDHLVQHLHECLVPLDETTATAMRAAQPVDAELFVALRVDTGPNGVALWRFDPADNTLMRENQHPFSPVEGAAKVVYLPWPGEKKQGDAMADVMLRTAHQNVNIKVVEAAWAQRALEALAAEMLECQLTLPSDVLDALLAEAGPAEGTLFVATLDPRSRTPALWRVDDAGRAIRRD